MKHPTEDPSFFGIDIIDELVVEYMQLDTDSAEFSKFAKDIDIIRCLGSMTDESDYNELLEVQDLSDFEDDTVDLANLDHNSKFVDLINQVCKYDEEQSAQSVLESKLSRPKIGQLKPRSANDTSPLHSPSIELKPLSGHLKKHKKVIRWRLSDLPRINPLICMHKILKEEEARPIRQQQRRLNPTILDVVKKEVTKLLAVRIIYPISDSQWVSLVQVVPKKSGMIVMKNQYDELATRKDHFSFPFIDQVLEKLAGKSHYYFLDRFSRYMQIHIAPEDQYKTTFTCSFDTFAYTRMSFGLCNTPSTFQ
ncbi:hypothetical protein CR513_24588, partial [Mucuna pruriens]